MSHFVESMESRRLLSASGLAIVADEGQLVSDARSIRSDVQHFGRLLKNDEKVVQSDLRGLPDNTTNRGLVGALRTDVRNGIGKLQRDVANLIRVGLSDAGRALADGIALFFNPNNSTAQSRLANDITRLQNGTAAPLATVLSDAASIQTKVAQDLTAISNANPTNSALGTHVNTATTHTASALTAAQNDVHKVQSDLATLLHDLG
jgi:hypothetical protein